MFDHIYTLSCVVLFVHTQDVDNFFDMKLAYARVYMSTNRHIILKFENIYMIPGTQTNRFNGERYFLSIYDGKLTQRVEETTEGAVKRINSEDKIVFEKYYDAIIGVIKDISIHDGNYGEEVRVLLQTSPTASVQISFGLDTGYAQDFLKKIGNVDANKELTISPYSFFDKEKKKKDGTPVKNIGMTIIQNGEKVQRKFTFENPQGFPFPPQSPDGQFQPLDKDEFKMLVLQQRKFLKKHFEEWKNGKTFSATQTQSTTTEKSFDDLAKDISNESVDEEEF